MMGNNDSIDVLGRSRKSTRSEDAAAVKETIADLMPWMATILLHAALVLIAILFVWATLDRKVDVSDDFVPVVSPTFKPPQPLSKLRMTMDKQQQPGGRPVTNPQPQTRSLESFDTVKMQTVGIFGSSPADSGVFLGQQTGAGPGTIFDPRNDAPGARSFVFVIDSSGSMIDTLPFVVAELKRTIRSLGEKHTFAVYFYQGDQVIQSPGQGLLAATPENQKRIFDWLDGDALTPSGLSDPMGAIERGLALKPQVMYLLSDNITGSGRYEINQGFLLKRIAAANIGKTKINTIQFLYPDPLSRIPGMKPTLERISEQTQGRYRFLSAKELGL